MDLNKLNEAIDDYLQFASTNDTITPR